MESPQNHEQVLSEEQGQALVQLARLTLENTLLNRDRSPGPELRNILSNPELQKNRGTFVTLHLRGSLRGCIGSLTADQPLVESVRDNAVNAALKDPRFPPLTAAELEKTHIEVSVLTEPRPLEYADARDLLTKLRPKIDGVILQKGMAKSTFLPQVWEQLPNAEQFLSQLCLKAGLPGNAWKTEHPDILTYQAQYFEEPK